MARFLSVEPKHQQLRTSLLDRISSGEIPVGSRLPTQRELMHEYGVSYSTVSRVTSDLVREGYLNAHVGRGTFVIRSEPSDEEARETQSIGILFCNPRLREDEFYVGVLHGIQDETWRLAHTSSFIAIDTGRGDATREKVTRLAAETSGFIVTGRYECKFVETLAQFGHPIVALGFPTDGISLPDNVDIAVASAKLSGQQAAEHLMEIGKRRIALVSGPDDFYYFSRVRAGYEDALREGGLDPKVISNCVLMADGREAARQLLESEERPDALVVASDRVFLGMLGILLENGVRVPADLPVVVVGGPIFEPEMYPRVRRVVWEDGVAEQAAVHLLLERIEQPQRPARQVVVDSYLEDLEDTPSRD